MLDLTLSLLLDAIVVTVAEGRSEVGDSFAAERIAVIEKSVFFRARRSVASSPSMGRKMNTGSKNTERVKVNGKVRQQRKVRSHVLVVVLAPTIEAVLVALIILSTQQISSYLSPSGPSVKAPDPALKQYCHTCDALFKKLTVMADS